MLQDGEHKHPRQIAPVALAYLGDTLFDLYLRTQLVLGDPVSPHEMHVRASTYANAGAQARMAQHILDFLTDEERDLLKRGRNQKSISVPRHADPVDYKWATGFEALLGYLYLSGKESRLYEVMQRAVQSMKETNEKETIE